MIFIAIVFAFLISYISFDVFNIVSIIFVFPKLFVSKISTKFQWRKKSFDYIEMRVYKLSCINVTKEFHCNIAQIIFFLIPAYMHTLQGEWEGFVALIVGDAYPVQFYLDMLKIESAKPEKIELLDIDFIFNPKV